MESNGVTMAPNARQKGTFMKIAVPSETNAGLMAQRSGHFGHCAYFTIVTIEDGEIKEVTTVKNVDHDEYGCGGIIDYVMTLDVDAILTAGMGRPPLTRFTAAGITVYAETESPLVGQVIKRFIDGEVFQMSPDAACAH